MRGKGGGLRLASAPAEIRVGAVVCATEAHLSLVECFDATRSACEISQVRGPKSMFVRAANAIYAELDQHTRADLLEPRARLRRLVLTGS